MTNLLNDIVILAKDENDGGMMRVIIFGVLAIKWIVGAVLKKASEKKAQEQSERSRGERANQLSETHQEAQDADGWEAVELDEPLQVSPPPLRPEPVDVLLRPIAEASPPQLPSEQRRKKLLRNLVTKRPRTRIPDEGHLSSIGDAARTEPATVPPPASSSDRPAGHRVRLTDPKMAKAAIIFHEILSPPKSLRDEPEMWD